MCLKRAWWPARCTLPSYSWACSTPTARLPEATLAVWPCCWPLNLLSRSPCPPTASDQLLPAAPTSPFLPRMGECISKQTMNRKWQFPMCGRNQEGRCFCCHLHILKIHIAAVLFKTEEPQAFFLLFFQPKHFSETISCP